MSSDLAVHRLLFIMTEISPLRHNKAIYVSSLIGGSLVVLIDPKWSIMAILSLL